MNRTNKKCFVASAGTHALLLSLLFLAPALLVPPQNPKIRLPVIDFIPSRIIDGAMSGGGSPDARTEPAPPNPVVVAPPLAPPPEPTPRAEPPEPEPKPAPREPAPKPRQVVKSAEPKESNESGPIKPAQTKPRIKVDLRKRASTGARDDSDSKDRARAEARARADRERFSRKLGAAMGAISRAMSSGTTIDVPGPGGEAFASYAQVVELFFRTRWSPPSQLDDDSATVETTVVIRRDGTVESFRITRRSGHRSLDDSVERLRSLGPIAPFPAGATDDKRTFIIEFDLKAKRPFG